MENKGIVHQIKDWHSKPPIEYSKITKQDIIAIHTYVFGREVKYTEGLVFTEEEVKIAINHFNFIRKYNL